MKDPSSLFQRWCHWWRTVKYGLLNWKHYMLAILRSWGQGGVGSRQQQTSHSRRFLSFISLFFPPLMACTKGSWYCLPLFLVHKTVSCTRLFLQSLNSWSYDETSRLEVGNNKWTTAGGSSVLFLFFSPADGMYKRQLVLPPASSCSQNCIMYKVIPTVVKQSIVWWN